MTLARPKPTPPADKPQPVRFTLADYLRMAEEGYFLDQRTEFIDGEILHMAPQKNTHAYCVTMLTRALERIVGHRHWVRSQATLTVGSVAAPEPDVAVVAGPPTAGDDYATEALFVAEVSETTLGYDRETKASLYALARVPEYWVVNAVDGRVEIHREPVEDPSAEFGWRYGRVESVGRDAVIPLPTSLDVAGATLAAADFLP